MKRILLILCLALCGCSTSFTHSPAVKSNGVDHDYVMALSVANRFLYAWSRRDQESGLALMSVALRQSKSEDLLRMYMSGISNPHHQAFEIFAGKRVDDDTYEFSVYLYAHYTGYKYEEERNMWSILLRRHTADDWRVDSPPMIEYYK